MILVRYIPAQDKRKYIRLGDFFNQSSIQFMSFENKKMFFSDEVQKSFLKKLLSSSLNLYMPHIHNQVPVMEAVKTVRCQETWNVYYATKSGKLRRLT